ncbi:MAG: hypothetical protein ACU84H_08155, partial [Gammaproteobacteria bacterium]
MTGQPFETAEKLNRLTGFVVIQNRGAVMRQTNPKILFARVNVGKGLEKITSVRLKTALIASNSYNSTSPGVDRV